MLLNYLTIVALECSEYDTIKGLEEIGGMAWQSNHNDSCFEGIVKEPIGEM
jgi:hypothetical protein